MREIKFRAWDKENNKWANMNLDVWGEWQGAGMVQIYKEGEPDIFEHVSDDRYIWQQYTGLKDKNKKPIFEGDIVKYDIHGWGISQHQKGIGRIVYCGSQFRMNIGGNELDCWRSVEDFEVIGNVWENPELLTGGINTKS